MSETKIPKGYKWSEVGVIPEEWTSKPLSCLATITHGFAFSSDYFTDYSQYKLTTPGHFYETGGFKDVDEKQKYYDGPVPNGYVLEPGDLIVAMTEQADGLLGSAAFIPKISGYLHNQRIGRVNILQSELNAYYLFCVLNSKYFRNKVRETAAGTKVKHTSPGKLLEICVRHPPLDEQGSIATALSDVDALIAGLDQLIAKKRDLKQATMQQLLTGQKRLPGFKGEWATKRLGDCLRSRPTYGINAAAVDYSDRLPVYIRITDISETGKFSPDKIACVNALNSDQYFLTEGDLVFARTGASVGKSYRYDGKDGQLVFAGFLIRIQPDPKFLLPAFLSGLVRTEAYRKWVILMSMRSGQPGINGNEFAQLPLPLPALPEQTAIATILSDMDSELTALEQRRDKTHALKLGMMQELLTGKTRLV